MSRARLGVKRARERWGRRARPGLPHSARCERRVARGHPFAGEVAQHPRRLLEHLVVVGTEQRHESRRGAVLDEDVRAVLDRPGGGDVRQRPERFNLHGRPLMESQPAEEQRNPVPVENLLNE